jgi:hypothetical protein
MIRLDTAITVAGEAGTLADFARDGRIQLHHTPSYAPDGQAPPRAAWWADVFSRDTIDAERYEISRADYEALLAAESVAQRNEDNE